MSETRHTPGPWTAEPAKQRENLCARLARIRADGAIVGYANGISVQATEANGLLMAASPELLKAAQESADALNEIAEEFGYHNVIMDAVAQLKAAIAKATEGNR